jgi:hypothetical protein
MQRGWIYKDPFQQLPSFDAVEDCNRLKALLPPGTSLYQYSLMPEAERKDIFYKIFGNDEARF